MSLFLVTSGSPAPECLELPQLEEAHAVASVHFTSLLTVPSSYHQYVLHMHNSDHARHRLVKAKEVSGNDRQPYTLAASRTYPALQNCSSPVSSPRLFTDPLMERPRAKRADLRHTFGLMQGPTQAINKVAGPCFKNSAVCNASMPHSLTMLCDLQRLVQPSVDLLPLQLQPGCLPGSRRTASGLHFSCATTTQKITSSRLLLFWVDELKASHLAAIEPH